MKEAQLVFYTRKKKNGKWNGKRTGCMVAAKIDGRVKFGFSLCRKDDAFDKAEGLKIATERMNEWSTVETLNALPASLREQYDYFNDRMDKYFNKE